MSDLNPQDFRLRMFKMMQYGLATIDKDVIPDPAAPFGNVKYSDLD